MVPRPLSELVWRRYVARNVHPWDELDTFLERPPAERRLELVRRLRAQLERFAAREDALPEWRDLAVVDDPDDFWHAWPELPVVTRHVLQERFPPERAASRSGLSGVISSTGGSTGEPLRFFLDDTMVRAKLATAVYTARRMGWQPGMPLIAIWGSERDIGRSRPRKDRVYEYLRNEILVDGYRLTDRTAQRILDAVRRHAPLAIYGFSSMLGDVALRIVEGGHAVPPGAVRAAWNGGEMLLPSHIETFRRAFGVTILNRYGCRELSTMACQFEPGGPLAVLRPWLFVEIVDDRGRPAAPGEVGRLLWTSTISAGTPFLRYDLGDLGAASRDVIDESGITALTELHGRTAGLLEVGNGVRLNNIFWNHLFKDYSEVRQFQVVIQNPRALRLVLVGAGFTAEREAALRAVIQRAIGDAAVEITWTAAIARTAQGKLVQVVREPQDSAASPDHS